MPLTLLIPAYQPSQALPDLVRGLKENDKRRVFERVVVVNDGSRPDLEGLFTELRQMPRVFVVEHATNLGKGAALKTGFNHILTNWPETTGVVTADADGQHAVEDILAVGEVLRETGSAVLGVRQFHGDVPLRSRIGNQLTRAVTRFAVGLALEDTQTGLRGWPRALCLASLRIPSNGYEFEMESLVSGQSQGLLRGLRQVPIRTIYQPGNPTSHFNPLLDSMRIYYVFVRYCASSLATMVTDNAFFLLAMTQTQNVAVSQITGRAFGVVVNFSLNKKMVFQSDKPWPRALAAFLALVAAMGVVSYGMIQFLHARLGWSYLACKLSAEGLLFLGNFAVQRELIFGKKPS